MHTVRQTVGEIGAFTFAGNPSTSAPATSNAVYRGNLYVSFQLISGAAATCIIEGSNEDLSAVGGANNWVTINTITLAGAGSGGLTEASAWKYVRARVTAATTPTSVLFGR